jgi:hypothetical protein
MRLRLDNDADDLVPIQTLRESCLGTLSLIGPQGYSNLLPSSFVSDGNHGLLNPLLMAVSRLLSRLFSLLDCNGAPTQLEASQEPPLLS